MDNEKNIELKAAAIPYILILALMIGALWFVDHKMQQPAPAHKDPADLPLDI